MPHRRRQIAQSLALLLAERFQELCLVLGGISVCPFLQRLDVLAFQPFAGFARPLLSDLMTVEAGQ